jgi:hypothetical protein
MSNFNLIGCGSFTCEAVVYNTWRSCFRVYLGVIGFFNKTIGLDEFYLILNRYVVSDPNCKWKKTMLPQLKIDHVINLLVMYIQS